MRAPWALAVAAALAALVALPAASQAAEPTGAGVTIAVLDTGIDSSHPEVAGRVTRESFAEPVVPGPLPGGLVDLPLAEDPDGQGTAVASIAAGATLGKAPAADLLDLQVSAKYTQQQTVDPVTEAAAIEALDALLRDPARADVVLLSFAQAGVSEEGGRTLAQQARGLWDAGVLVVVPTGPGPNPLADAAHVLTVGAAGSCGSQVRDVVKPDLVANATNLPAAQASDPSDPTPGGGTTTVSGPAYAAAQAAGAAALLLEVAPALPVDAVAAFLRDAAHDAEPGLDGCGFGTLDEDEAVAWARMWRDPLASGAPREAPGVGVALLFAGLAAAAWVGRRHG